MVLEESVFVCDTRLTNTQPHYKSDIGASPFDVSLRRTSPFIDRESSPFRCEQSTLLATHGEKVVVLRGVQLLRGV